jgi:uncharacterized protein (TIGR02145 family)
MLFPSVMKSQVIVGDKTLPQPFSLLEISTNTQKGGFRLPQLTTAERDALDLNSNPDQAGGLIIYNIDNNCLEIWNLKTWVSFCDEGGDAAVLPKGKGSLSGKSCFDIAESNDNKSDCARVVARKVGQANFNMPAVNTQIYTFKPIGTVSKVRFAYIDPTGKIVKSLKPNGNYADQTGITDACSATMVYRSSLSSPDPDNPSIASALGLTRDKALTADVYAIYNDDINGAGEDKALKLTVSIKDCACCGAMSRNEDGTLRWLNFMCYNLGAEDSGADPFIYSEAILGDLYQWGRLKDGHQIRTSKVTSDLADSNIPGHDKFIKARMLPWDWRTPGNTDLRWGGGTDFINLSKGTNDPCPTGWKVPSRRLWGSLLYDGNYTSKVPDPTIVNGVNQWTWVGSLSAGGWKIGDSLFLPAAGYRDCFKAALELVGTVGNYWSTTRKMEDAYMMGFRGDYGVIPSNYSHKTDGFSVRCVQEK